MRQIEAPRTSAAWAFLGIVLWLVLVLIDMANNGASWRTVAYALLALDRPEGVRMIRLRGIAWGGSYGAWSRPAQTEIKYRRA
jgi:hypothetical protein